MAQRPNINILASKATTAKKKSNANIPANKTTTANWKSDTNKILQKADISKIASNLY